MSLEEAERRITEWNSGSLDLQGLGLSTVPESIGDLVSVIYLKLDANRLTTIPESIDKLENLEYLMLTGNHLTSLPDTIGNLTNLKQLLLSGNQLTSLPDTIGNLTNLTRLKLDGNQLRSLPKAITEIDGFEFIDSSPEPIGIRSNILYVGGNCWTQEFRHAASQSTGALWHHIDPGRNHKPNPLKPVGYWTRDKHISNERFLPDPAKLVDHTWCFETRDAIVAYLQSGNQFERWRGYSYCRFDCGIENTSMGSRCLTDGTWVWPEGLAHYIERHAVRLPNEFIAHMRGQQWTVPVSQPRRRDDVDRAYWITWGEAEA